MAEALHDMRIGFLVANEGVEQVELTEPWRAVEEAGGTPVLIAPEPGTVRAMNHLDWADTFEVDRTTDSVRANEFGGFVLPGGVANPDQLRTDGPAVELLRAAAQAGIPIAVICHGPWTLVEADLVRDRMITSWPSLRTDLINAGADWMDQQVVKCPHGPNTLVSSRKPDDLDAFCTTLIGAFADARDRSAAA